MASSTTFGDGMDWLEGIDPASIADTVSAAQEILEAHEPEDDQWILTFAVDRDNVDFIAAGLLTWLEYKSVFAYDVLDHVAAALLEEIVDTAELEEVYLPTLERIKEFFQGEEDDGPDDE